MSGPVATTSNEPVKGSKAKADVIWQQRAPWDAIYQDAYDYVIPHRRPEKAGASKRLADKIFDMTGPSSAMHFPGTLQRNIFPAGMPPFTLEPGPLTRQALPARDIIQLERRQERVADFMHPFFMAGDFDPAVLELCTDLGIGTGAIIPLKGDFERPLMFCCIPTDEIATQTDVWGRDTYITWQRTVEAEALIDGFRDGAFTKDFRDAAKAHAHAEHRLYQDFWRQPDGSWRFCAYVEKNESYIVQARFRTQPVAIVRYHRLSGEAYGRGPILMALPAIKTLNKAQELTLKAAAIQMLGIWGYRAGGTFNPDTVRIGPAEFWPMQSTGGILGPDVSRLDPASARIDIAQLLVENLQGQVRAALLDDRLPERPGTPEAATTVAARLRQAAESHIGSFGRMWREVLPVVVPRSAEILNEFGYLNSVMNFNELITTIGVRSPMASALKASQMMNLAQYVEAMAGLFGPDLARRYYKPDSVAEAFAAAMLIEKKHVPTPEERAAIDAERAEEQAQAVAAEMATKAAPQLAGGLMAIEGGKAAA